MVQAMPCRKPANGGGCIRDDDFDDINLRLEEHDRSFGRTLQAASNAEHTAKATHVAVGALQASVRELADGMVGFVTRVDQRFDDLETRLAVTRATQASIDLELDATTGTYDVSEWAGMARSNGAKAETLEAENAALKATIAERDRQSERVRVAQTQANEFKLKKWQIWAGLVTAVVGGGGLLGLIQFLATR